MITTAVAFALSPTLLAWLSPTLLGLVLAVPLSKASSSLTLGKIFARLHLFLTPEETDPPTLMLRRDELERGTEQFPADGLQFLARNRQARLAHISGNLRRPTEQRGHPDPHRLTAHSKLADAKTLHEALEWLNAPERIHVASDARLLERLAELPDADTDNAQKHSEPGAARHGLTS
jgi:membrane glycosyltransferase